MKKRSAVWLASGLQFGWPVAVDTEKQRQETAAEQGLCGGGKGGGQGLCGRMGAWEMKKQPSQSGQPLQASSANSSQREREFISHVLYILYRTQSSQKPCYLLEHYGPLRPK